MISSEKQGADSVSREVRTIFVSDVHLGCMHSRASEFLEFLNLHEPESLYLVGDLIDGWKLRKKWRWPQTYNAIFDRVEELSSKGTEIFYTPGNHDNFLRDFGKRFGFVTLSDEFVHITADGRRFLIIHGDQFDKFETGAQWLSILASFAYDVLLTSNTLFNRLLKRKGQKKYALSSAVKSRVKQLMRFISHYEQKLAGHARENRCEGIICGHIHAPNILDIEGVNYCNTGDWVEHCSALIEYGDGKMEIVFFDQEKASSHQPMNQEQPVKKLGLQREFDELQVPGVLSRFLKRLHPLRLIRR
ncbi:UDP-2,3-diacylglucosamine diphosphatase [Gimesia aquarii]|uniref:UDP-2,3-diacylglucosamine hydrolase n=1 Tax=Gimesia aquarii TaxID=2527964 RepID=A0A517VXL5_9PLAN|nr:UDP-2,3-diacylglucosamine diphosphatase [Gimesia aquarii]QDT97741.1 UDP-2,3-diacylglucosamine hydrolase [Gimesia aquarii]QDU11400.1 UDP-2,3-diacylglucosamine hydrolase [Gimesia aquarii]